MRRYTLICEEHQADRVEELATKYGLTEQEVLRQLLDAGLEAINQERKTERV